MKNDNATNQDRLAKTLAEWRVDAPLPRGFKSGVWNSIESARSPKLSAFETWLEELRAMFQLQRATACTLLIAAIVAGVAVGKFHADRALENTNAALGERYIASIDPDLRVSR